MDSAVCFEMHTLCRNACRLWCCGAGLLFFTTYTLLVLFWAEIYHQARSMPTASLRPIFIAFNALVYACQVQCGFGDATGSWGPCRQRQ